MSRKEFFESFSIFAEKNNVDETWTASMTGFWSSIHDYQLVEKGTNRCCLTRPKKDVMQTRFSTMDATEETGMSCVDVSNKVWGSAREWGVHSRLPRPRLAKAHRQWSGDRHCRGRGSPRTAAAAHRGAATMEWRAEWGGARWGVNGAGRSRLNSTQQSISSSTTILFSVLVCSKVFISSQRPVLVQRSCV